jgi:pimeloyl-ACP methyl ester carboxylesterase
MIDISRINYAAFDHPEITGFLFHPRPEWPQLKSGGSGETLLIPIESDTVIGARLHISGKSAANMLFFHGNGEIVADYNDVGHLYTEMRINFLPVDYRGYGQSTGRPTVTAMMRDSHVIFDYMKNWLKEMKHTGPFIIMGRSLGSASALELASYYKDQIDGMIIESGFAFAAPLLRLLGINMAALGIKEEEGFRNIDKIRKFDKPTLIIHAEYDHIISFQEGQLLFDACSAGEKRLLKIPGANHNDIFFRGMSSYLDSIRWLVNKTVTVK